MIVMPTYQYQSDGSKLARWYFDFNANGTTFILNFYWSTREASWYFDLFDVNNNPIIVGIKIVPSIWLLNQYGWVEQIIGGNFCLKDQAERPDMSDLTFDTFGVRYFFIYALTSEKSSFTGVA